MTQTTVERIHIVDANESPAAAMQRLGKEYNEIMSARMVALNAGMTIIHDRLVAMSKQNEAEQTELLNKHPELILLAMTK